MGGETNSLWPPSLVPTLGPRLPSIANSELARYALPAIPAVNTSIYLPPYPNLNRPRPLLCLLESQFSSLEPFPLLAF